MVKIEMNMPKSCSECNLYESGGYDELLQPYDGSCFLEKRCMNGHKVTNGRPNWCPLKDQRCSKMERNNFINEADRIYRESDVEISDPRIARAIGLMTRHKDDDGNPTLEAVGAAKVLLLSVKLSEFFRKVDSGAIKDYTGEAIYSYIKDIYMRNV